MVDCRIDPRLKLYEDLDSELNISEEKSIRSLISDKIPRRELDELRNVADIFTSLDEKGYIKISDLNLIKLLLKHINRRPLIQKVIECEEKLKLYKYPATKVNEVEITDEINSDEPDGTPPLSVPEQKRMEGRGVWSAKLCICLLVLVLPLSAICITFRLPERNKRSVLFLNDEWGTSKGGIWSLNRQLALQARDAGYVVYVTFLDPPCDEDKKDAEDNGINLITADTLPDVNQNINLNMLNNAHQKYFPSLENITNLHVIVGNVPITSEGALNIRQKRFPKAKVYLFTHVIPQDTDFHKGRSYNFGDIIAKVDTIIRQAEQADLIFSVGPKVYKNFKNEFRGSKVNDDKHKEFIPIPDSRFFDLNLKPFTKDDAYEILTVGGMSNVENLKGYDIVAAALGKVATRNSLFMDGLLWRICGISEKVKGESDEFIKKHLKSVHGNLIDIYPLQYGPQKLVTQDMQKSRLFLVPSRIEPFGMVGLEALAAGIPVLVTANSGLADFLKEHFPKHMYDSMIVSNFGKFDIDTDAEVDTWVYRITDVLLNKYDDTFNLAREVKDKLIEMKCHPNSQIFKDELKKLK